MTTAAGIGKKTIGKLKTLLLLNVNGKTICLQIVSWNRFFVVIVIFFYKLHKRQLFM